MPATPTTYAEVVNIVLELVNLVVIAIFAFAFAYFIWKIIDSWVLNAGDEKKQEEGKKFAVAAIIAFVIMASVWGIVRMVKVSILG